MPLALQEHTIVLSESTSTPKTFNRTIDVQSSGVLLSLFVQSLSGSLDVNVYTLTRAGEEKLIDTFPTISAPTTELILRKQVEVHNHMRVEVITSDAAVFDIRAKGVESGIASVQLLGANAWNVQNESVTTRQLLISADLDDRNGLLIRNANFNGLEILRIAETEAKLIAGVYASVLPGESLQPDIRAGSEVWAESSGPGIRVEIVEIG